MSSWREAILGTRGSVAIHHGPMANEAIVAKVGPVVHGDFSLAGKLWRLVFAAASGALGDARRRCCVGAPARAAPRYRPDLALVAVASSSAGLGEPGTTFTSGISSQGLVPSVVVDGVPPGEPLAAPRPAT